MAHILPIVFLFLALVAVALATSRTKFEKVYQLKVYGRNGCVNHNLNLVCRAPSAEESKKLVNMNSVLTTSYGNGNGQGNIVHIRILEKDMAVNDTGAARVLANQVQF